VTTDSPDDCLQKAQDALQSHDMVIGDCPGGLGDLSRTIVLLSDLALPPISPSILDLRSVQQATTILRYAQASTKWESKEGKQGKARHERESKGTHVNAGGVVPLILRGVVDLHLRTWFNLVGNAG